MTMFFAKQTGPKCVAPLMNVRTEMELVVKGTAFLKTHAASHGLKTRNRKRHEVSRDISNHYISEHGLLIVQDLPADISSKIKVPIQAIFSLFNGKIYFVTFLKSICKSRKY